MLKVNNDQVIKTLAKFCFGSIRARLDLLAIRSPILSPV